MPPDVHWFWQFFGLHEVILYLVIVLLIGSLGGGPLLRAMFNWILRLLGRGVSETIINVGPQGGAMPLDAKSIKDPCASCGLLVDPTKCVMHQAEHERSLRNEEAIRAQWENMKQLRADMTAGFKETQVCINESQRTILGALGGQRSGFHGSSKGGQDA